MATALKKNNQAQIIPDEVLSGEKVHQLLSDPENPLSKAYNAALVEKANQRIADQTAEAMQYYARTQEDVQQRDSLYRKEINQKVQDDFNQGQIRYNEESRKSDMAGLPSTPKADPEVSKLMGKLATAVEQLQNKQAQLQNIQTYGQELAQNWVNLRRTMADEMIARVQQGVTVNGQDIPLNISEEAKNVYIEQVTQPAANETLLPYQAKLRLNANRSHHYTFRDSIAAIGMMKTTRQLSVSDIIAFVESQSQRVNYFQVELADAAINQNRRAERLKMGEIAIASEQVTACYAELTAKMNGKDSNKFNLGQALIQVTQITTQMTTTLVNVVKMGFGNR